MGPIEIEKYRSRINKLLFNYGFKPDDLIPVEDVQEWCTKRDIEEKNPFRTANCVKETQSGQYKIIICKKITCDQISSIEGAMICREHRSKFSQLTSDWLFLKHLLLHEIAHSKGMGENDADIWAFSETGIEK